MDASTLRAHWKPHHCVKWIYIRIRGKKCKQANNKMKNKIASEHHGGFARWQSLPGFAVTTTGSL